LGNRDVEGRSPCHTFFNKNVGKALLLHKEEVEDLQGCDADGMSITHYVAWSSQSTYLDILASIPSESMALLVTRDYLGRSAIHFAAQRGNIEVLQQLVKNHTTINCRDREGRTALHYAVESKRVEAISVLVSNGADIRALDSKGRTPLHRAAAKNNVPAINCLLDLAGKDFISEIDHQSENAEQVARSFQATAAAEHLKMISTEIEHHEIIIRKPTPNLVRVLNSTLSSNSLVKYVSSSSVFRYLFSSIELNRYVPN
jgi:ankyrin repeat protein